MPAGLALAVILLVLASGRGPAEVAAQTSAPWVAPESEKAKKNPLPADKKAIDQGEKVAKINCVSCHGPLGKGNGPAAVALNPKPADWTSKRVQDEPDGEIFWKITNGRGPCPRGGISPRTIAGPSSDSSARSRGSDRRAGSRRP